MTTNIQLREVNSNITDFTGFKAIINFQTELSDGSVADRSVTLDIQRQGKAAFEYADDLTLLRPLSIAVKSPRGQILNDQQVAQADIIGIPDFTVEFDGTPLTLGEPAEIVAPRLAPIQGRLLEKSGKADLGGIQIIFFASSPEAPDDFQPLVSVKTEASGYFLLDDPGRNFEQAVALVGIKAVNNRLPVKLDPSPDEGSAFPKRLILVIELESDTVEKEDCDCGECQDLNFHQPKKILEEYTFFSVVRTSDPEIRSFVLKDEEELTLADFISQAPVGGGKILDDIRTNRISIFGNAFLVPRRPPRRRGLPPSIPAVAIAPAPAAPALTDAEIVKKMGDIKINKKVARNFLEQYQVLNQETIPKLIEMNEAHRLNAALRTEVQRPLGRVELDSVNLVDWDQEPTLYQATSIAYGHLLTWKQEWLSNGYSLGDLLYSLPLAPGQKKDIVMFDWQQKLAASKIDETSYRESLFNSLQRDRDITEIVTGTLKEDIHGESSASTGGFGAAIGGVIGSALFGIGGGYSKAGSSANQQSFRHATSSDMQKLRDRTVQSANAVRSQRSTVIQSIAQGETFEVSSETVANYNHCHAMTIEYFEVLRHFRVQQRLVDVKECLFIPLFITEFTAEKAMRWKEVLFKYCLDKKLKPAFDSLERAVVSWVNSNFPDTTFAAERIENLMGDLQIIFTIPRPADKLEEVDVEVSRTVRNGVVEITTRKEKQWVFDPANWTWFQPLLGEDPAAFHDGFLKPASLTLRDAVFQARLGNRIVRKLLDRMRFRILDASGAAISGLPLEASLLSRFHSGVPATVSLRLSSPTAVPRERIEYLQIVINDEENGVSVLPENIDIVIRSGKINYRTRHFSGPLFTYTNINNDLNAGDGVLLYCGPTAAELRNPKQDDVDLVNRLIRHLNDNLEYYHNHMFQTMPRQRLFMLLDGVKLKLETGEYRSVASLVENTIIGVAGNSIIMPVAAGLQLNPDFKPQMLNPDTGELVPLIEYYDQTPMEPLNISVPTAGVFAEAVMGRCNSCEVKDESRFWRWEESPIPDEATPINPVSTPVPTVMQPNLQATPLAAPVVNVQTAPAAPDPTGMAGLLQLLGKGDSFRDVTGLAENQKNALATFQSSLGAAQAMATQAANLETQKSMERRLDNALNKINSSGLPADKKNELTEKALNAYMGGGATKAEEKKDPNTAKFEEAVKSIDQLEKSGVLTPEEAKAAKKKVEEKFLNTGSGSPKSTADMEKLMKTMQETGTTKIKTDQPGADNIEIESKQNDTTGIIAPEAWADIEAKNPALKRFFNPDSRSITGIIEMEAVVHDLPTGATFRWSTGQQDMLKISDPAKLKTQVHGGRPGTARLTFEVLDNKNNVIRRVSSALNVPQFFLVAESFTPYNTIDGGQGIANAHTFDAVLAQLKLTAEKEQIIKGIREIVDKSLIRTQPGGITGHNLHTVWAMAPFNEKLPKFVEDPVNPANTFTEGANYTVINLGGYPHTSGITLGSTIPNNNQPDVTNGPQNPSEFIQIYPGAFELDSHNLGNISDPDHKDRHDKIEKLIATFRQDDTNADVKDVLIKTFIRIVANSMCHEIYHSVIFHNYDNNKFVTDEGFDRNGHTLPSQPADIMTEARNFEARTGIAVTNFANFPADPASFTVAPIESLNKLNAENTARIDLFFPLPPALGF